MKVKRICFIAIAALLIVMSVLFPISVSEPAPNQYVFRIGNIVTAHDPDFTCDGTDDHIQFQQVLDALPATVGGSIEVEAGYYSFGAGETVSRNISNVSIIGVGGLVSFDGDDTTPLFTAGGNNWRFENIVTDAGGIDTGATSGYLIRNVLVGSTYYAFVTDNIDIEDHSARHESGGDDAIKLDDLATPDNNTDLDATTGYHGLLPKLAGNTSLYLRSDGTWQEVSGGGTGDMLKSVYDSNDDGLIDNDAGGTAWDSSAITGVAYITSGTWSSRPTGIADTNIVIVSGTVNSGEHCRFTADGIEGLTSAELLVDISGEATAAFDWNAQNLINVGTVDGRDVSVDGTKLDGIEAGADVTDATNVDAAGAVMESDYGATTFLYATLDNTPETKTPAEVLAILSGEATAAFDWNAQNLINVGTVDGRDVSADGTKLDGIEAGADVTDATNVDNAGAVMESDYDADTFLYAATDDTPAATSPADVLAALSGHAGATFDWNGQTLADFGIEYGATLDTTPITAQLFLHTPTGRNNLYQYDGSDWQSVMSLGIMTVYVDATDGTDDLSHGTGVDSNAFKTIQYAIDQVPPNFAGDVNIYVNDETYNEDLNIQGKQPAGSYSINIIGTLSSQETASSATVAAGSGATQGTVTKVGQFAGDNYENLLAYFVTDDEYRVIDSHTDDVLTLVGTAPSSTSQDVAIYDWGTSIDSVSVQSLADVNLYNLSFSGAGIWRCITSGLGKYAAVYIFECELLSRAYFNGGYFVMRYSVLSISSASTQFDVGYGAAGTVEFSKLCLAHNTADTTIYNGGSLIFRYGSIVDGYVDGVNEANEGLYTYNNGMIKIENNSSKGYVRIRNCDNGIYADSGGMVTGTTNTQYSGNTNDETAISASYGYID